MDAQFVICVIACVLFVAILLRIAYIDYKTERIPNGYIGCLATLWLVLWMINIGLGIAVGMPPNAMLELSLPLFDVNFYDGLLAAVLFGLGALLFTVIYEKLTSSFGMGGGDIKLLCALGLFMGIFKEIGVLLIACILLILASVIFKKKKMPFGPAIVAGAIIALFL